MMTRWLWLSAAVVVADQISKWLAVKYLLGRPPVRILPVFDLTLVYNTGAAFGLLNDASGWQNAFFVGVAVTVSTFIVLALRRTTDLQVAVSLALILGGAIGNVVDRLQHGYVIDFLHWFYRDWHWPTFNVADSAITVGAVLLVMDSLGLRVVRSRRQADQ